jgi:hypothetical protein
MGRLKGQNLIKFGANCKRFYKVGGTPRQIKFEHNSHEQGNEIYEIITEAYSDVLFGTMSGMSRKDWTFKTDTAENRDAMFADLEECVEEYKALVGGNVPNSNTPLPGTDPGTGDPADPDDEKKTSDLTTYIIIGAAAAIIIALLIPWKKSKK